jgi:hypothetical protein
MMRVQETLGRALFHGMAGEFPNHPAQNLVAGFADM